MKNGMVLAIALAGALTACAATPMPLAPASTSTTSARSTISSRATTSKSPATSSPVSWTSSAVLKVPKARIAVTAPTKRLPRVIYYASCIAARAAGAAPMLRGKPGYRPGLDRDHDGIACE